MPSRAAQREFLHAPRLHHENGARSKYR